MGNEPKHVVTFKVSNGLAVVCTCGWEAWASWPNNCTPQWAMNVMQAHLADTEDN